MLLLVLCAGFTGFKENLLALMDMDTVFVCYCRHRSALINYIIASLMTRLLCK